MRKLRVNQQRLCGIALQSRVSLEALEWLFDPLSAQKIAPRSVDADAGDDTVSSARTRDA
jgi:hypothetical protein